ncbi:MAG: hypothetical protein OCD02_19655 [Spirochaetaceae bacterium]
MDNTIFNGVMLNVYPDSIGGNLDVIVDILKKEQFKDLFSLLYILPSMFKSDLDRGFSIKSYDLDEEMVNYNNLEDLQNMNINLKLDFVLNHLSVLSPQFQDLLNRGDKSKYVHMFIDWNRYWEGKGTLNEDGLIIPNKEYLSKLFMRKPGLPVLKVPFPDGSSRYYWNTFYQKITKEKNSKISYLGQMDLNANCNLVWEFYEETFRKLSDYGSTIVRLDAFAYLHKKIGYSNFFNEPGTWEYLARIKSIADRYNIVLLPEIHSKYEVGLHEKLADKGYAIYDFFFPGLVLDAIEFKENRNLLRWIKEIQVKGYKTFNMLGCHDGIPLLDVKGLLDETRISDLISIIKKRGGRLKDLFGPDGEKISYYQINSTFFSALDEDEKKFLLARAIQIFMPGVPIVWYLDLFAGTNDYDAANNIGHKDINRTNLNINQITEGLDRDIVTSQLKLIKFRNNFEVFKDGGELTITKSDTHIIDLLWIRGEHKARLFADLKEVKYYIEYKDVSSDWVLL